MHLLQSKRLVAPDSEGIGDTMKFSLASTVCWLSTLAMLAAPAVDARLLLHSNTVGGKKTVFTFIWINIITLVAGKKSKIFVVNSVSVCKST